MRDVHRLKFPALLLLAFLTAGQLAGHHHSLNLETGNSSLVCAACAYSADGIVTAAPQQVVLSVAWTLAPRAEQTPAYAPAHEPSTRGPPAA